MAATFDLGAEIDWFLKHQAQLERDYPRQYLLIRDQRVQMVSGLKETVISEGLKRFGHHFYLAEVGFPKRPLEQVD